MPLYFGAADVVVCPSYYESFSLVTLEAMACGRPVIAARTGGLPYLIEDGVNGFLVERQEPDIYVAKLRLLLEDEDLRLALGKAGRMTAEGLTWERTMKDILSLYQRIHSKFGSTT